VARIDDYRRSLELAREELKTRNPLHVCRLSGALFSEKKGEPPSITLPFLNQEVFISWPDLMVSSGSNTELPIKQEILILHYLSGSKGEKPTGEWIAYQDIPSARFYLGAFNRRVKYPLVGTFGEDPVRMAAAAKERYGANTSSHGDVSVIIQAFPQVPVMIVMWKGDEEFPPDGTILFDSSIKNMLSAEDISELVSMVVYPLLAAATYT
jgi:hypothetical protein